jgi:hypothetical protein
MDNRNLQFQQLILHLNRIETEIALIRQLVDTLVISGHEDTDQDLILVDVELVLSTEEVAPSVQPPQEPAAVVPVGPRTLTRRQILQDGRWRAQNWAIRDRQTRSERQESEDESGRTPPVDRP